MKSIKLGKQKVKILANILKSTSSKQMHQMEFINKNYIFIFHPVVFRYNKILEFYN